MMAGGLFLIDCPFFIYWDDEMIYFMTVIKGLYFLLIKMSRPSVSPYRRNTYNNNNGRNISPYREEPFKLTEVKA